MVNLHLTSKWKYIIHHANGHIVYPDPLKLISKLGNKSLVGYEHVEEFRISLLDVAHSLFNEIGRAHV